MRRIVFITCLVALALPAAAGAQAPDAPELAAQLTSCVTGVDVASRSATFSASMPAVAGSSVLAMRFDLERRDGGAWKAVAASSFGRWERSVPGAAGFVYDKRVERLPAPVVYRVTVRFRWYDAAGHVLRVARRRSESCRQLERRPNLEPIRVAPGGVLADGMTSYAVTVRNAGATDAAAFRVGLSVGGVTLAAQTVPALAAARSVTITFAGPACRPGEALRIVTDPDAVVDEADEADNVLVQRCVAG